MKQKFNVAGLPDQGMLYIDNCSEIPAGIYSFEKGISEGSSPVPITITRYKNIVKLSKKTLRQIKDNL